MGILCFVAIKVGDSTLAKTIPYMVWYYIAILAGLMLVTYVPFLSMGLPMMAGLRLKKMHNLRSFSNRMDNILTDG